ncbi:diguanylate cyclase [Scytonema sp. UIC 10036]|uniref:sensor domain-containing diguanylate cyclase n=1 Tax=Scytonema sp. UIC 10036 TaxID=2304196 RepID=UPI0012DA419B|nr:diguanylate cyclase [Scytonema sp. UIC 10036]MUG98464.1 diguanylate cyclase [Scytonema sp. UIC 10036]
MTNDKSREELQQEVQELRARLEIAEETLRAICQGEADALVVSGSQGEQIFTLRNNDSLYRRLIEEVKEGAATLTDDGFILYCNRSLARLLKRSIKKAIGSDFNEYITPNQKSIFKTLLQQERGGHSQGEFNLIVNDLTTLPIHVDISSVTINDVKIKSLIVTDLTEQKRNEEIIVSEKLARSIVEQAAEAIVVCDETGQIIRASIAAHQLCGQNLLFQPFDVIFPLQICQSDWQTPPSEKLEATVKEEDNLLDTKQWFFVATVLNGESFQGVEVLFHQKDGQQFNLLLNARLLSHPESSLKGCILTLTDITIRKQAELELQLAKADLETRVAERTVQLQQLNAQLTNWVKELEQRNHEIVLMGKLSDMLQACLTVEEAYYTLSRLIQSLFPNMSGGVFLINASKNLVEAVATWGDETLVSQKIFTPRECWGLRRGRIHLFAVDTCSLECKHIIPNAFFTDTLCVPMMAQGKAMGVLHLSSQVQGQLTTAKKQLAVTVAEHIALALANLKLHETIQEQNIRDPLTGLFNRRYLEESLEREIQRAKRKQLCLGVMMLDVDYFKRFNDTFSHEAGDMVLRELGRFLKKQVRGSDIACRYGGEEMTLILPETSLEATIERAEQIRAGVKHLKLQNRNQNLGTMTLSVGVACFPEHGLTGESVIHAADEALYRAKKEGRDRVVCSENGE